MLVYKENYRLYLNPDQFTGSRPLLALSLIRERAGWREKGVSSHLRNCPNFAAVFRYLAYVQSGQLFLNFWPAS
jgi:hypothetical protein